MATQYNVCGVGGQIGEKEKFGPSSEMAQFKFQNQNLKAYPNQTMIETGEPDTLETGHSEG